ncbi:sigma-70 family RNA polymerase sigma factor [Fulvivirgaceae bacterium BMA10]|uniref:Sigma-70 family RNA polymerase sigma factor n=1 Tax=Splendidivirga corallicola TaxID=3051826 RepID=A0ABT8KN11_9BACT|nr:sigma-70 family RNA polymerase sigma factor [Fulvivirgaceae bacterium BMA10]
MRPNRNQTTLNSGSQKEFGSPVISLDVWEDKPDVEVWKSFKGGDEQAFNFLYRKYVQQLFNYGCQFSRDKEFVKDCIQDLFIYLRRQRSKLGDTSSIKAYLFKSLRRDVLRKIKKEKKRQIEPLGNYQDFEISLSPETKLIHGQLIEEKRNHLEKALAKLSVKQREAIILYYYENLGYKEIAEILEMKMVKSARKLVYRAMDTLRDEILPYRTSLINSIILLIFLQYFFS